MLSLPVSVSAKTSSVYRVITFKLEILRRVTYGRLWHFLDASAYAISRPKKPLYSPNNFCSYWNNRRTQAIVDAFFSVTDVAGNELFGADDPFSDEILCEQCVSKKKKPSNTFAPCFYTLQPNILTSNAIILSRAILWLFILLIIYITVILFVLFQHKVRMLDLAKTFYIRCLFRDHPMFNPVTIKDRILNSSVV